jgi:hypothetical protein
MNSITNKNTYQLESRPYESDNLFNLKRDLSRSPIQERSSQSPIILCEIGDRRNPSSHRHRYLFYPSASRLSPYSDNNTISNFNLASQSYRGLNNNLYLEQEVNRLRDENRLLKEDYQKRYNAYYNSNNNYGDRPNSRSGNNNYQNRKVRNEPLQRNKTYNDIMTNLMNEEERKIRGPLGYYNYKDNDEYNRIANNQKNLYNNNNNNPNDYYSSDQVQNINNNPQNRNGSFDNRNQNNNMEVDSRSNINRNPYYNENSKNNGYNENNNIYSNRGNNNRSTNFSGNNNSNNNLRGNQSYNERNDIYSKNNTGFSNNNNNIINSNNNTNDNLRRNFNYNDRNDIYPNDNINNNRKSNYDNNNYNNIGNSNNRNSNYDNNYNNNNNRNNNNENNFNSNFNRNGNNDNNFNNSNNKNKIFYVDNNNIYSEDINNNEKKYSNDNNNFPNSNSNTKRDTNINTGSLNNNNNLYSTNNERTGSNFGFSSYGNQFSRSGNFNRDNPDNQNLESIIYSNSNNPNQRGNNTFEEERKGRSSMPNNIIDNLSLSESRERGGFSATDENMENKHNFSSGDNQNPNFKSQDDKDFNRVNNNNLQNLRNGTNNTNSNQNQKGDNNNLTNNNNIINNEDDDNTNNQENDNNDLVKTGEQPKVEYNILVDDKKKEILNEEGKPFIGEVAQEVNIEGDNIKVKKKDGKSLKLSMLRNLEGGVLTDDNGNPLMGEGNIYFVKDGKIITLPDSKQFVEGDLTIPVSMQKAKFDPTSSVINNIKYSYIIPNENNNDPRNPQQFAYYSMYGGAGTGEYKRRNITKKLRMIPKGDGDAKSPIPRKKRKKSKKKVSLYH